jgi:hypothetical protein
MNAKLVIVTALASLGLLGTAATATADGPADFTIAQSTVIAGGFAGFGGQFNQHVYAKISGPPPDLPGLESKVTALQPRFARVFFNTSEWAFPDRMESFIRTVQLAQRAQAQIDVTWQGSTYQFAAANMSRFADVLADLVQHRGVDRLWVTLFNEPNSTRLTLAQYEQTYRLLDRELRDRGVRDRIRFMGGDLVGTDSPLGQSQEVWLRYLARRMGDLLDAWSIHVFWDFWDTGKIDRRLVNEVLAVYATIPAEQRRPLYVTEFGVRGLGTFEGEPDADPGSWLDGQTLAAANVAAFQEAWFMLRASGLGFTAALKWDLYGAAYDAGRQDYSVIGPGTAGWPLRPSYELLRLFTHVVEPGSSVVTVDRAAGADPAKLLTAYVSPPGNLTILGLDTGGAALDAAPTTPVDYRIAGLPPNTLVRLLAWNAAGDGHVTELGYLDTGTTGAVEFTVPLQSVFALTTEPAEGA